MNTRVALDFVTIPNRIISKIEFKIYLPWTGKTFDLELTWTAFLTWIQPDVDLIRT